MIRTMFIHVKYVQSAHFLRNNLKGSELHGTGTNFHLLFVEKVMVSS
jgi:hypothetical protein